jgi:hypothetical protein
MKKKINKPTEDIDLFAPIDYTDIYKSVFGDQDAMAKKSSIFRLILQSEIKNDPKERYLSTNSPNSKTRNALLTRYCYQTQEEWEKDLLANPFYNILDKLT